MNPVYMRTDYSYVCVQIIRMYILSSMGHCAIDVHAQVHHLHQTHFLLPLYPEQENVHISSSLSSRLFYYVYPHVVMATNFIPLSEVCCAYIVCLQQHCERLHSCGYRGDELHLRKDRADSI